MGLSTKALETVSPSESVRMLGEMLAPVTDKVQGKGGDQVWLNQPLLHVPVLLLPLPFLTSSLTVHIRLESHLDSIADRGGKGLFLPLTLSKG